MGTVKVILWRGSGLWLAIIWAFQIKEGSRVGPIRLKKSIQWSLLNAHVHALVFCFQGIKKNNSSARWKHTCSFIKKFVPFELVDTMNKNLVTTHSYCVNLTGMEMQWHITRKANPTKAGRHNWFSYVFIGGKGRIQSMIFGKCSVVCMFTLLGKQRNVRIIPDGAKLYLGKAYYYIQSTRRRNKHRP